MQRLIDANAAADKIMHEVEVHADEIGIGAVAIMIAFARALRDETDFPTIEPEVRHGKGCSYCKGRSYSKKPLTVITRTMKHVEVVFEYCPACGRKMDGGDDNG